MSQRTSYNEAPYYVELFRYFMGKCDYAQTVRKFVQEDIFPMVHSVLRQDQIKVLSIGPGTGVPDLQVLQALDGVALSQQRKINILYTVVEPDEAFVAILQTDLTKLSENLENVRVSLHFKQCKVEDYLIKQRNSFDIILLLHSLYYMNIPRVIPQCYDIMTKGGCIAVLLANDRPSVNEIVPVIKAAVESVVGCPGEFTWLNNEELVTLLKEKQWNFSEKKTYYNVDFTDELNENSVNSGRLIEFFAHIRDFKEKVSRDRWTSIISTLKERVHYDSEMRCFATFPDDLVLIWR